MNRLHHTLGRRRRRWRPGQHQAVAVNAHDGHFAMRWGEIRGGPPIDPESTFPLHSHMRLLRTVRPPTGDPEFGEGNHQRSGFVPQRWGESGPHANRRPSEDGKRVGRAARGHRPLDHRRGPYEAPFSGPGHGSGEALPS